MRVPKSFVFYFFSPLATGIRKTRKKKNSNYYFLFCLQKYSLSGTVGRTNPCAVNPFRFVFSLTWK